ncbi:MAG: shikimate kinase [Planctomycetaceae bacterium]|nr:shikimate kinase [Planctomycetaceae bacterium]
MSPHRIALIGYRGTGKTTVARHLAELLQCKWIDADVELERRAGKSIAAIFADEGEGAFRDLEAAVVADLCGRGGLVAALGGGAVLREDNRAAIAACDATVWLRASAAEIERRLSGDPTTAGRRPNLTNTGGRQEIDRLLGERTPIYAACATLVVDTDDKAPEAIAAEIAAHLAPGPT